MAIRWPNKDPDEVLDYGLDWSGRLNGDALSSVQWSVTPAGLTLTPDAVSGSICTVIVSGGALGETYSILCRAVTIAGRIMDQTVRLAIRSK